MNNSYFDNYHFWRQISKSIRKITQEPKHHICVRTPSNDCCDVLANEISLHQELELP